MSEQLTDERVKSIASWGDDTIRSGLFAGMTTEMRSMARELLAARERIAALEAEIARLPVRNVRVKNGAIEGKLFGEGD